jgi:rSAM/selenodomain-associated transferase 1
MPGKEHDGVLIVFLRHAQPGKVKTRLAATMGDTSALSIYRQLVSITLGQVRPLPMPVILFYDGGLPSPLEMEPAFSYQMQCEGTLGEKMADAFSRTLPLYAKAMIIGSDCPTLTTEIMLDAFRLLDDHDVVIGPAEDGGYYLIGCKALYPFLFDQMPWGTTDVLSKTMAVLVQNHLSFGLLPELNDVDTEEDWNAWSAQKSRRG